MNKDLENLLDECNVIEYKQEVSEGLFKSISAFSNTNGGCIILGVEDETKNIVGIDLSNGKQEALTNKIIDLTGIQPNIELLHIEDKDILKITVEKSSVPIAYKNKYYKRVGNTTREANKEELKKLLLKDISWDSITNSFTLDDIDEKTVQKFVKLATNKGRLPEEAKELSITDLLTQLELIIDNKLTNGAILLFGKNPQKLLSTATIRVGLFKGDDESVIISDKNITGNLFEQIEDVDSVLKLFINMRAEIKGFQREDIWDYPLPALREAVLNAIIHKDYFDFSSAIQIKIFGDSIWIYNSGDLFGGLTLDKLTVSHTSKSRNPLIMKVIYMAGYVEQFGTGIKRMITACLKQGIPAPIFETSQGGFILQMYKQYNGLNERQNKAIKYVVEQGYITTKIYQEITDASRAQAKRDITTLCDRNIFVSAGENKNVMYKLNIHEPVMSQ